MSDSAFTEGNNITKNNEIAAEDTEKFVFKEKPVYSFFKRLFDIICSLIAIIVLSPILLIIIVVIICDDKEGKPIFKQVRVGKNNKTFKIYKFRTMCVNAEKKLEELQKKNEMDGPVFKIQDDPRITRVGKFLRATSLDELPQLVNILKGDMSIVGPRPALPKEVAEYDEMDAKRLLIKPGLTCYWQICKNRNSVSFKDWMKLDRKYIQERNIWVDIKTILKTVLVVIKRDGC